MERTHQQNLIQAIERIPKVELHVHFGGAISSETVRELAEKNGVTSGEYEEKCAMPDSGYGHLKKFLDSYRFRCACMRSADDFEAACIDVLTNLRNQNVKYAEITESPTAYRLNNVSTDDFMAGVEAGVRSVCSAGGIGVRFIFDIGRQFGANHAWKTVREAAEYQEAGVIAVGLGGDEIHYSPEIFTEQFEFARKQGLHKVAHAGEVSGSQSIWGALESLRAERIGHGVSARGDEALLEHLRMKRIPLEMCPTSNIKTGAVRSYADHPLPEFLRRGLLITLNSDDPAMFGTSLSEEYRVCIEELGLGWEEIKTLSLNGVKASFLPDMDKAQLLERFEDELAEIESDLDLA